MLIFLYKVADGRRGIVGVIVIRIHAALERTATDLEELRRFPAVAAQERHADADVAGLDRDRGDVVVIAGNEDDLRRLRLNRGQLRTKVAIALRKTLPRDDLSA